MWEFKKKKSCGHSRYFVITKRYIMTSERFGCVAEVANSSSIILNMAVSLDLFFVESVQGKIRREWDTIMWLRITQPTNMKIKENNNIPVHPGPLSSHEIVGKLCYFPFCCVGWVTNKIIIIYSTFQPLTGMIRKGFTCNFPWEPGWINQRY